MTEPEIREMIPDDSDGIAGLDMSSREPVYDLIPSESGRGLTLQERRDVPPQEDPGWSPEHAKQEAEKWRQRLGQGYQVWGAFVSGRLVGFCVMAPLQSENCRLLDTVELHTIFIDREFRHQGIGRRFVAIVEEACRKAGRKGVYVGTSLDGSAVEFYLKAGFRLVGLHERVRQWMYGRAAFFKPVTPGPSAPGDA
jgi:GNAT superfamily N-acetyltransferase